MVKIEFKEESAVYTALQARIDAMKELKEKKFYVLQSAKNGLI